MNISYKWLKRYINLTDDAQTVAKILTSIGLEVGTVETVQTIKGGLEGLVVGQVLTCVPHPNSDHLHITTTDYGEGPVQIVCGAPNVAAGQKVIVATIGTRLYSGDESFVIKRGKIRGEESLGMLCAEDEIGVGTSHDGIIVLPEDTPIGMTAKEYYHIEDDTLIEVDITPNRSDGASHYGVARDLYAYYQATGYRLQATGGEAEITLTKPDVSAFKVDNHDLEIKVSVENTDACPRYSGVSIQGVTVKESPDWLKNALTSIGLRSINNIVDVTNFVLFEMGQALHAFDADKIAGKQIIVKNANQGQKFVTLDGVERELDARDLMICNANEPMCIAGVFGGLDSGVTEATTNVFLESAYFDPVSIRKTARRHQLQTDASFRYERGCDPNNTMYVLQRAALLMQEVAGGTIAMEPVDECREPFEPFEVEVSLDRVNKLIGKELGKEMIETIMSALEMRFTWQQATGDSLQATGKWLVKVPRYRVDVQRECDVVEDILRIYGYNNIEFPEKVNTNLSYCPKPNVEALQKKVSEQLTAQGFNEIMNNSLTKMSYYMTATLKDRCAEGQSWLDSCVKIKNPLSQDLGVMRQTLLFGGLESIARNVNRKNSDLRFYEFGNCYHFNKCRVESVECRVVESGELRVEREPIDNYSEEMHLGLWLTGNKSKLSWVRKEEKSSFYQLHAYVNAILTRLGVNIDKCSLEPAIDPNGDTSCGIANLFSDGLVIKAPNKAIIGYMAIVSPATRKSFDIDNEVFYADLYWDALVKLNKQYKPVISDLPKFPEVKRDFALLVNKEVEFADLARAAFETERKLLKNVFLFDVYEGKNLEEGKKSYALSFILQDEEDTLKDKQIENIMERLKKTFETKFEAKLR
ncbi:MAG: phenylalanine--tRNA ligase subunit beta [Paludibacteraceae bacterium]|nr:phenylalanine--tRNA ligase subunit beta [Paludibacteraceae bacterium]